MKINRETLLNALNAVKPGLSAREFIEQSSCFVFADGWVVTFNDEISCRIKLNLGISGAVKADTLLAVLEKIDDTELEVLENEQGEVEFQGKRKRFGLTRDAEIFLPVDKVEKPGEWSKLPQEFTEAVGLVQHCVSADESRFIFCCINITPKYIEACDNIQLMRCDVEMDLDGPVQVRGTCLAHLTSLGMEKISITKSWIHFKNADGLIFSTRRWSDDYPNLDKLIEFKGNPIVLPKGLSEASERASILAQDKSGDSHLTVRISQDKLRIIGEGLSGWYREVKSVAYDGPELEFVIAPELLKKISDKYKEAEVTSKRLKAVGEWWQYVTCLGQRSEKKEEEAPPEEKKKKSTKDES